MTEAHVRDKNPATASVVVRCWEGVFDVQHLDGKWTCSCGHPECHHVDNAVLALQGEC